jgi:carbon-monoxide dehydrogenase medium subunit
MDNTETYVPESLDEVAALLLAAEGQPHPVVTGAVLLTQVHGAAGPTRIIVDLARVPEMNRLEYDERNGLLIGAAVPLEEPLRFPPLRGPYAILADGMSLAGLHPAGARATLGERLSTQEPDADLALPLICLGASVAIFGPHGWSEMSVEALCARKRRAALLPGEFIVDARLPACPRLSGGAYVQSVPGRSSEDALGAGVFLVMQDDVETCCGARLMLWAEGGQPLRALDTERFLHGRRLEERAVGQAGDLAVEAARLPGQSGSAEDRPKVLRDLACQAIRRALERARPRPDPHSAARRK